MEKQMNSQFYEVNYEKYFPEHTLIDASVISPTETSGINTPLNSGIIFG